MECIISEYEKNFDIISVKIKYFKKLRKINSLYGDVINNKYWNKLWLQHHIGAHKNLGDLAYSCSYEVVERNGINILNRGGDDNVTIQVLSAEECFSDIVKAHLKSRHGGVNAILNITDVYCQYPMFCIHLVLQSCNVCRDVSTVTPIQQYYQISTDKSEWMLTIYKIEKYFDFTQVKYIITYTELVTSYTIIKPLYKLAVEDLGTELLKIFTMFGPPKKLFTHSEHVDLVDKTLKTLASVDNSFMMPIILNNDYFFQLVSVIDALKKWSLETNSHIWSIGCSVVERILNTSVRVISPTLDWQEIKVGIPYNLFFGIDANTSNHGSGNIVSEQLHCKSRNRIILSIKDLNMKPSGKGTKSNVTDKMVDLNESEDEAEINIKCHNCNKEFPIYNCAVCQVPLHYKCGTKVQRVKNHNIVFKLSCIPCSIKNS